ncbi:MAG: hypothetical protein H0W68_09950, partial [Gemmatimonadaceae bacterium]|nr:hypothetical protein [Gemmatimonadaceae bacterium]
PSALWSLLDVRDRLRGSVVATSGGSRVTAWLPVSPDTMRWGSALERLRAADTTMRETGTLRAPMRSVPVAGRAMYFQPTFVGRSGAGPSLLRVTALANDSVRQGRTLVAALWGAGADSLPSRRAPDFRARTDTLYRTMRAALSRGDWLQFGQAFDALGTALRTHGP